MEFYRSESFRRDFKQLTQEIQERAEKQFEILLQNPRHPSLRKKKMKGKWEKMGVYEARVTEGYRFTFQINGFHSVHGHLILRWPFFK